MAPQARTVVLESVAQQTVDSACDTWEDAERAWVAIEWTLAHDPAIGVPLTEQGNVRGFLYDGAQSIGQPDIEVIYEIQQDAIIVRSAVFRNPEASFAGRG
jgi:hypothetical protein